MTKNKFFPYALNSSPLHPQLFITYGGEWRSEDLGVSRGFQGGREGWNKSSLTECKGG